MYISMCPQFNGGIISQYNFIRSIFTKYTEEDTEDRSKYLRRTKSTLFEEIKSGSSPSPPMENLNSRLCHTYKEERLQHFPHRERRTDLPKLIPHLKEWAFEVHIQSMLWLPPLPGAFSSVGGWGFCSRIKCHPPSLGEGKRRVVELPYFIVRRWQRTATTFALYTLWQALGGGFSWERGWTHLIQMLIQSGGGERETRFRFESEGRNSEEKPP